MPAEAGITCIGIRAGRFSQSGEKFYQQSYGGGGWFITGARLEDFAGL
jgi:hypothetical protein